MNEQWQTFVAQIKADKKKSILMAVLAVVMLVMVGRLFIKKDPAAAEAVEPVIAAPVIRATPQTATSATPANAPPAPAVPTKPRIKRAIVTDGFSRQIEGDLFANQDWSRFASPVTEEDPRNPTLHHESFWHSMQQKFAETQRVTQAEDRELLRRSKSLVLQSTVTGRFPVAYISGLMVRPGDRIAGFTVAAIGERSAKVKKGRFITTLTMP